MGLSTPQGLSSGNDSEQDQGERGAALAPKVYGTMILFDLLKRIKLDFMVLFPPSARFLHRTRCPTTLQPTHFLMLLRSLPIRKDTFMPSVSIGRAGEKWAC